VHGNAGVQDNSDGYTEAWYLPDAANIPAGYAKVMLVPATGCHSRRVLMVLMYMQMLGAVFGNYTRCLAINTAALSSCRFSLPLVSVIIIIIIIKLPN
jgi:hypothetical protein